LPWFAVDGACRGTARYSRYRLSHIIWSHIIGVLHHEGQVSVVEASQPELERRAANVNPIEALRTE